VATYNSPESLGAMQPNRPQQAIEHAARTLESLWGRVRGLPEADGSRMGVLAFNFNGLAALVFQMRGGGARAVVSLDGVEGKENGARYLLSNDWFAPTRFTAPYLVYEQDEAQSAAWLRRTIFDRLRYADRTWVQVRDMRHPNHFPNHNRLPGQRPDAVAKWEQMAGNAVAFFDRHVKGDAGAAVTGELAEYKQFAQERALPGLPDEVELDRRLMSDLRPTLELYAEARRRDPDLNLMPESAWDLYAFRYRQQGRMEDVLAIRRAVAGMFPESALAALRLAGELRGAGKVAEAVEAAQEARKRVKDEETAKAVAEEERKLGLR
jgi:hypothetical protein